MLRVAALSSHATCPYRSATLARGYDTEAVLVAAFSLDWAYTRSKKNAVQGSATALGTCVAFSCAPQSNQRLLLHSSSPGHQRGLQEHPSDSCPVDHPKEGNKLAMQALMKLVQSCYLMAK